MRSTTRCHWSAYFHGLTKGKAEKRERGVNLLKKTILESKAALECHPVNVARRKSGKRLGNMIWPWGGGGKPSMPSFMEKYGLGAAVISAVDLVKGIGIYTGMQVVKVPGATGL